MTSAPKRAFTRFIAVLFWVALPTAIWNYTPFYDSFRNGADGFLLISFFIFLVLGFPAFYIYESRFGGPKLESKSLVALKFLPHIPRRFLAKIRNPSESFFTDEKTRVAFLAMIVKIFFFPIMLQGILGHGYAIINFFSHSFVFSSDALVMRRALWQAYNFLFYILIFLDASIFALAYIAESKSLNNEIKSVEPTFSGWLVALLCYPPFNSWFYKIRVAATPSLALGIPKMNIILLATCLVAALLAFLLYVWASFALGYKAGNLVNRGIVNSGPYAFIRHPAYIGKNLGWLFILIPAITNVSQILLFASLAFTYFLRAITEERHLKRDPDYVAYCKEVPYRFIPGIY